MRFVDLGFRILAGQVLFVLLHFLVDALVMRLEGVDFFVGQLMTHESDNKRAPGSKLDSDGHLARTCELA